MNFIEDYQIASQSNCNFIINWFENNTDRHRSGWVGESLQVDTSVKDSTDISMEADASYCSEVNEIVLSSVGTAVELYKEKYYHLDDLGSWGFYSGYNLQRYYPGQGYPRTHCEQGGCGPDSPRMLVWTLYLNDVTDRGETFYPYQRQAVTARAGKVCLFPAAWTHMHRGIISPTQTKYIATGWFNYYDV